MVELKSDAALEAMREAGRVVARALAAVRDAAAVGTSLADLDEVAHGVLRAAGARSPFLHYHPSFAPTPFPAVICTSLTEVQITAGNGVDGMEGWERVRADRAAELAGWPADAAGRGTRRRRGRA